VIRAGVGSAPHIIGSLGTAASVAVLMPANDFACVLVCSMTAGYPFCKYDDHMLQLFTSCPVLVELCALAILGSWTCKR